MRPIHEILASEGPPKYHHVSLTKFLVLSFATGTLYVYYWFFMSWRYVKRRDESRISPFWRAVFSPLWYYSLGRDVEREAETNLSPRPVVLAVIFFLLEALWRLPDPYWAAAFLSPLAVVPAVLAIDSLNRKERRHAEYYSSFGFPQLAACLIGVPVMGLSLLPSLNLVPSTQVVEGWTVPSFHEAFLRERGLLDEGEEIVYYYSAGLFSHREDGNYFTDRRVVSYWIEQEEFYSETAQYPEISEVLVEESDVWLDDTRLTVVRNDDTEFFLIVSPEADRDQLFIDGIVARWGGEPSYARDGEEP